MKKMYIGLSIALLMSGAVYANTVNITNNSDTAVYVVLGFQSVQKGKNLTTGQATDVCYQGGSAKGYIAAGKSGNVDFTPCQPGVNVNVYATKATTAREAESPAAGARKLNTLIGTVSKLNVTVGGKSGSYTIQ